MKIKLATLAFTSLVFITLNSQFAAARAQGTAFTYQGRLNNNGVATTGLYDFRFRLAADNQGNTYTGSPFLTNGVPVTNGLFTTTIDFGAGIFTGSNYWLEVDVRTNGAGGYAALFPLQAVTPTPYSIMAESASGLTSLTVQQNADGAPNLIGGASVNFVSNSIVGATIGGGGADYYLGVGSFTNSVSGSFGTVGGGAANNAGGIGATVAGGDYNTAGSNGSFVGGGEQNTVSNFDAIVGGGQQNTNSGQFGTIGGSYQNIISSSGTGATVAGGTGDAANNPYATVGGGVNNIVNGYAATVPGGYGDVANGSYGFAAGNNAHAANDGSFVWSDGNGTLTTSAANNSVTMRASGGYRFFTGTGTGGASLAAGATSWTAISDRNVKKNFQAVDTEAVLDKLATVPIQEWNYKWEKDSDVPNIGPMAQDFKHAFYPGRDDKGISTLEFDGVELAAIQGLNQKLQTELNRQDAENTRLKQELAELKQMVLKLADKKN